MWYSGIYMFYLDTFPTLCVAVLLCVCVCVFSINSSAHEYLNISRVSENEATDLLCSACCLTQYFFR